MDGFADQWLLTNPCVVHGMGGQVEKQLGYGSSNQT